MSDDKKDDSEGASEASSDARRRKNVEHERWLARWSKVWVPILVGALAFLAGVGTCVGPYLERDVRNRVYEATYLEKERALKTQSELLVLQEQ